MARSIAIAAALLTTSSAVPCTIFIVARGDKVYAGANEDMSNQAPYDRHWVDFRPAKEKAMGYVLFGYAQFPMAPQAGMNEAGLFFDYNALPKLDVGPAKPAANGELGTRIMAECRTVKDVVKVFNDNDWVFLSAGQMVVGDATGDSAIIERNAITYRGKADYQIGTNFRTSTTAKADIDCWRYKMCDAIFSPGKPIGVEVIRETLALTAPKLSGTETWYSTVCDLKATRILLFRKKQFSKVLDLDLKKELAKGARRVDMDDLMSSQGTPYIASNFSQ